MGSLFIEKLLTSNPINNSFKSNINLESKIKQIYVDFKFAISAQN